MSRRYPWGMAPHSIRIIGDPVCREGWGFGVNGMVVYKRGQAEFHGTRPPH